MAFPSVFNAMSQLVTKTKMETIDEVLASLENKVEINSSLRGLFIEFKNSIDESEDDKTKRTPDIKNDNQALDIAGNDWKTNPKGENADALLEDIFAKDTISIVTAGTIKKTAKKSKKKITNTQELVADTPLIMSSDDDQ